MGTSGDATSSLGTRDNEAATQGSIMTLEADSKERIGVRVKSSVAALGVGPDRLTARDILARFKLDRVWTDYLDHVTDCSGPIDEASRNMITPAQAVSALAHIGTAVAYRHSRCNISSGGMAGPLMGDPKYNNLGIVLRTTPTPSPIRTYDVATSFYVMQTGMVKGGYRKPRPDVDLPTINNLLFSSLVLRLTGRVSAFAKFSEYMRESKGDPRSGAFLPDLEDTEAFLDFVELTTLDDRCSLKNWLSGQHASSIPASVKHYPNFKELVESVAKELTGSNRTTDTATREDAVSAFKGMLDAALTSEHDQKSTQFIASQVIADVEEVVVVPFGLVTTVTPGYGGMLGISVVKDEGANGSLGYLEKLHSLLTCICNIKDSELLDCLGLKLRDGEVVIKLNGRSLTLVDAEHFACKIYVCMVRTQPTRACSEPRPSQPHCHPTVQVGLCGKDLNDIMEKAITAYESMTRKRTWPKLPNQFLLVDETILDGSSSDEAGNKDSSTDEQLDDHTANLKGDPNSQAGIKRRLRPRSK
jgi:hypothetical protein